MLLVTEDVKEDWYRKVRGKTISARPELAQEAKEAAGCDLVIMRVSTFLARAKKYVQADVSDDTIREAENLSRQRMARVREEMRHLEADYDQAREELERARNSVRMTSTEEVGLIAELQILDAQIANTPSSGGDILPRLLSQWEMVNDKLKRASLVREAVERDALETEHRVMTIAEHLNYLRNQGDALRFIKTEKSGH